MQGIQQKEISRILGCTERTIKNWREKGNWDEQREEEYLFKETASAKVRKLINHNLEVLTRIAEKQHEDLDTLEVKQLQERLISRADADGLSKLYAQIKGKEASWDVLVRNVRELLEFFERENVKLAQQMLPLAQEFLNKKREDA